MFTGIVQNLGEVALVEPQPAGAKLVIHASGLPDQLTPGESIAVNGCCLSLTQSERIDAASQRLAFDVIHQTLRVTTLGSFALGRRVNLERAVTPTTLLGGHIVQGHVDGVGEVKRVATEAGEHRLSIAPPLELMRYITGKGSITVDGVSLTIASVDESRFEVALIPTTLELTTLRELNEGSSVNLEADALAKMVARLLERRT
jgi:riboflavin synthase